MENNIVIKVCNITKKFKVYLDKGHSLKERVVNINRNRYEVRNVINGISFEIKQGEAVGLVGHNGCGKSTTLKMLTRIMYPDSGTVQIKGRVSSLLELGAGFHPDMTGRENIYTNASIFGLKKKEIDSKLQDIIEFSELEEYIDNPVRTYSSGMYMRLAFSVAINVNADILLIDEILAVGDVNFQEKCFNKLFELKNLGTTIVIVSHSMGQVERICDRSIWIHDGKVKADGKPNEVDELYLEYMDSERKKSNGKEINSAIDIQENESIRRRGSGEARITNVVLLDENNSEVAFVNWGSDVIFKLKYESTKIGTEAVFGLCINRIDGVRCYGLNMRTDNTEFVRLNKTGNVELVFNKIKLLKGSYSIDVTIESKTGETIDYWNKAFSFEIVSTKKCSGVAWLDHEWKYE